MSSNRMKEDVYESEDLPEAEQLKILAREEETNDPEHVELVHIDIDAARKRFDGRVLNFKDADFSDSIAKKRMHAYGTQAYVLEVVGSAYAEPETPEQKFNRLTYELNELSEQFQQQGKGSDGLLSEDSINQLKDELKNVREPKGSDSKGTKVASGPAHIPEVATGDALLVSMEQRLRRIETLVGPLKENRQPLVDAVEDLRFRAEALSSTYVEGLESRLNQVLTKLEQAESKGAVNVDGEIGVKVDELLQLMTKWDVACANLPSSIKKVQALHSLHEQAQHFSTRMAQLVDMRSEMEKTIASDRNTFKDMQVIAKSELPELLKALKGLDQRQGK